MVRIVDKIIDGSTTMQDIIKHNIEVVKHFIEQERNNRHPAEDCKRQYCHHGSPIYIQELEDHLAYLKEEIQ